MGATTSWLPRLAVDRSTRPLVVPETPVGIGWALGTLRRVRHGWRRYHRDPSASITLEDLADHTICRMIPPALAPVGVAG